MPSPPILADRCIRLRTGDLPFTRLCPDCLQLSLKSVGSVFTWFSRLPNASNSLSRCKLVDSGGVKLLSGLLSWNESSMWISERVNFTKASFFTCWKSKAIHRLKVLCSFPKKTQQISMKTWVAFSIENYFFPSPTFPEQTHFYWYI